ncbi:6-phosphogluconolactonase [Salinisphaera sp. LB1]|uniref:6-phosphogluconolactonase n=1 Tax=Salinisphaera sp. LB1 TaxID=2183911 RepID=UPI000D706EE4|nr:6-phosphogluconolactonase [Salinisphaera sp. LB1]AWN16665.1 6-phosphogluconolactonase, eukaryotic type [Salinisphaera sp. LB1]
MAELTQYSSRTEAARELSASIAERLREAIAERGEASLVVCGGSSPRELFEFLSAEKLAWSRVTIVPSDERWMPVDDQQSNERLVRQTLLVGPAAEARFVGLYRPTDTPGEALDAVAAALTDVPRPLDVVLLGMGDDGHTASLFPHAPDIQSCLDSTAPCVAPSVGPPARLSLSLAYLTDARSIDLLIFGDEKRHVFERAQAAGPMAELPVRGVLHLERPVAQAHWAE